MGYREIPIGYSHADVAGLRPVLQNYLACGDPAQAIDFFGLVRSPLNKIDERRHWTSRTQSNLLQNAYEWCGASTYTQSGYQALYEQTVNYPVPIFMSEVRHPLSRYPPSQF